jgi:hypothetical protein
MGAGELRLVMALLKYGCNRLSNYVREMRQSMGKIRGPKRGGRVTWGRRNRRIWLLPCGAPARDSRSLAVLIGEEQEGNQRGGGGLFVGATRF